MSKFSMHEFKDWLSKQNGMDSFFNLSEATEGEDPRAKFVGCQVQAKVSRNKLMEKIESETADSGDLVDELIENGGTIIDLNGKNLLIEVDSGTFLMPRFCFKILRDE